jgi:pSer/pThr/pTyr-binding forkhead associated (FHA) protein
VEGPYAGQRFELTADEFWIGSRENSHLCLSADPGASGNHACVRREKNILRLYDNGSLNNTWINGRALRRDIVILREGGRVRIGGSEFILEA